MYGFVNVDIRPEVNPDLVDDVFELKKIEAGSVELIYACHVLEHACRAEVPLILNRWFEVLKPKGVLRVCVPDLRAALEYYKVNGSLDDILGLLYGGQRNEWDFHRTGFDRVRLTQALHTAGFMAIAPYDWRLTEHSYVDDYSQSYLPEISYKTRNPNGTISGTPVSLNLEAIKCA